MWEFFNANRSAFVTTSPHSAATDSRGTRGKELLAAVGCRREQKQRHEEEKGQDLDRERI